MKKTLFNFKIFILYTVLNTLGVFDIIAPTYAAAVMFELYEGKEDFLVEISYRCFKN